MTNKNLIIIAGLCVIENEELTLKTAEYLKNICSQYPEIDFIFKASFDKANRTSIYSFRGVKLMEGLRILRKVKQMGMKILTDIHQPQQANIVGEIVDIIQIPAFLCRQTDLVNAAAKTGKTINIKKGQFIAPEDVINIVEKIEINGNTKIMITERGTCFGYHNLIVDYRSFLKMKEFGYSIIFDATHSQQEPSKGLESGGTTKYTVSMAKGAIATGVVDGLFVEVHPNPKEALSDKTTSLNFKKFEQLLKEIIPIWRIINK